MPRPDDPLFPIPLPKPIDDSVLNNQTVVVPGTKRPGQTGVYRNALYPELVTVDSHPDFPKTQYEVFERGIRINPDGNALGWRPFDVALGDFAPRFEWLTYAQAGARRTKIGAALIHLAEQGAFGSDLSGPGTGVAGVSSPCGWSIGLWSANRPEWQLASQAAYAYSLVTVSLYDTLGPNVVEYCINHSSVRIVFASPNHIPTLLSLVDKCPTMKVIVSMDKFSDIDSRQKSVGGLEKGDVLRKWGQEKGIKILDLAEIEALGETYPRPHIPPPRKSVSTICYTSGTTGNPKGAVMLHENMACAALANLHSMTVDDKVELSTLSFLPLSHIYERFVNDTWFIQGSPVAYACGDNLRLIEDIGIAKPTALAAVPRVLNRIYQVVKGQTLDAPGFKGRLVRRAYESKLAHYKATGSLKHAIWDRLVFNKVKAVLGGKVEFIGTGSAPISPQVLEFMKIAFGCVVYEGYGQTENGGVVTKCFWEDRNPAGAVGPPQVVVEIKLVDVPDMGYTSEDKPYPRGELCMRGQNMFAGYYKDEKKTQETIDEEGWLHSGDVAAVDEKGRFKIIDRIKNLIKLSQGEYVAVEVENVYALCSLIAQIYVHGDSLEDHLVAIVVPDPVTFAPFASGVVGKPIAATDHVALGEAARDPRVVNAFLAEMHKFGKQAQLKGFETARQLHITWTVFSQENDILTPTMKVKRNVAAATFKNDIDALYKSFKPETRARL